MADAVHCRMVNVVARFSRPTEVDGQDKSPVFYFLGPILGYMISHYTFTTTAVRSAFIKLAKCYIKLQ